MITRTAYLIHQGSAANRSYTVQVRKPMMVTRRFVPSEADRTVLVPLYETHEPFIFNFCHYGMERRLGLRVPLGSVVKMTMLFEDEPTVITDWSNHERASID